MVFMASCYHDWYATLHAARQAAMVTNTAKVPMRCPSCKMWRLSGPPR